MNKNEQKCNFGLVGKEISYSFSRQYFQEKFSRENINNATYVNFDLANITELNAVLKTPNLKGFNVTIPYKEAIIKGLDYIEETAQKIGAINTVKILPNKKTKGYNTDVYGFELALKLKLQKQHKKALILGSGGASKAVKFVFDKLAIPYIIISRNPIEKQLSYKDITPEIMMSHLLIINTTPLGTFPNIADTPNIPYAYLTDKHYLFDLVYNPLKTQFLINGEKKGASIQNGLKMLEFQAEKAWEIWKMP